MEFDDILNDIGVFGRFQWRVYIGVFMCSLAGASINLAQVFLAGESDHWCYAPELNQFNCSDWSIDEDQCFEMKKDIAIPQIAEAYENCIRYDLTDVDLEEAWSAVSTGWDTNDYTNVTMNCNEGWVYDTSQFQTTIISEFDLVCNKRSLPDLAQSMFFVGMLIGSVIFGAMSDRYGRYWTYVTALLLAISSTFLTAVSISFAMYIILRTIGGAAWMGVHLVIFTLLNEFVGPSKRTFAGFILSIWIVAGLVLLVGIAYLIRQWRILMFVLALTSVIPCILLPLVTESPRWLISKGRFKEAEVIIRKVARINGKELSPEYFNKAETEKQAEESVKSKGSVRDLFLNSDIRARTLNLMWTWCVVTLVYYGLTLNMGELGGDIYVSFLISGLIELPAHVYVLFTLDWLGRKPNLCGSLILGGIACLVSIFIPVGAWRTTVVMFGKFCICVSFATIYIFTVEQFPTPVRNMGLGLCSTFARFGSISAPLILIFQDYWKPLPYVIFGVSAMTGGLFTLWLPETVGRNLPESVNNGGTQKCNSNTQDNTERSGARNNRLAFDNPSFVQT